jgi:hypothetical protein
MTFQEALQLARGPAVATIAGWMISALIEWWPEFQALQSKRTRVLVYILLCMIVPLAATIASIATGIFGAWTDIANTWWPAIWAGIGAAGLGTLFHAFVPEPVSAKATSAVK